MLACLPLCGGAAPCLCTVGFCCGRFRCRLSVQGPWEGFSSRSGPRSVDAAGRWAQTRLHWLADFFREKLGLEGLISHLGNNIAVAASVKVMDKSTSHRTEVSTLGARGRVPAEGDVVSG